MASTFGDKMEGSESWVGRIVADKIALSSTSSSDISIILLLSSRIVKSLSDLFEDIDAQQVSVNCSIL